jgi:hypothetical protein
LLLITFRPEFTAPWIGRPHVTSLTLYRLPRRQAAEMIVYVTGGKALPKEISDQIVDRTDGVPLFIEELTKAVVESGILTDTGDCYTVTAPVAPLAIPTSLHASLLARFDRLGAAGRSANCRSAWAPILVRVDQRGLSNSSPATRPHPRPPRRCLLPDCGTLTPSSKSAATPQAGCRQLQHERTNTDHDATNKRPS